LAADSPNLDPQNREPRKAGSSARMLALVMELPVTLVGCIAAGGGLGYLLDRRFHFDFLFTLILGATGFALGITQVIRRLSQEEKQEERNRQ